MAVTSGDWSISRYPEFPHVVVRRRADGREDALAVVLDKEVPNEEALLNAQLMADSKKLLEIVEKFFNNVDRVGLLGFPCSTNGAVCSSPRDRKKNNCPDDCYWEKARNLIHKYRDE